jgi:hypothetical protein
MDLNAVQPRIAQRRVIYDREVLVKNSLPLASLAGVYRRVFDCFGLSNNIMRLSSQCQSSTYLDFSLTANVGKFGGRDIACLGLRGGVERSEVKRGEFGVRCSSTMLSPSVTFVTMSNWRNCGID